jgi:diguanylate cyclase (GGDEF)-like protein
MDSQESVVEVGAAMLATAQHAHKISGVIAVARSESADPWTNDDRTLLLGVANQLGIAIEQAKIHEELQILSRTDALTGMLNRRAFIDEAGRRFGQARRYKRAAAVLYIDLNNFKLINDRFGHRHGDKAIRAAADLIRAGCRSGDVVARVGGDEFIIWLDETNATGAQVKATALVADSERLQHLSASAERPLGLAIGLAALDPDGDERLDALVERADKAMYVAKRRAAVSSFAVAPAASSGAGTKAGDS